MKSFKNKILQKGRTIKALKHSASDINKIADSIGGRGDKTQQALEIANQNAENTYQLPNLNVTRGDYDTLERIESKKLQNVASRTLSRKFGSSDDYIEAHIYNTQGQLLQTVSDFEGYQPPTNTDNSGKVSNFVVNPVEVLSDLGYSSGQYKLILNIQKKQILNSFGKIFTIKEISPSRQELKISFTKNDKVKTQLEIFLGRIEDATFYKDFVLNFGQNRNELGINIALNNHRPEFLIKLFEPLDSDLVVGDIFRIATEITDPISMDVDLGEPLPVDNTIQLQGPNYNIDTRLLNSVPSQYKTFDTSLEYSLTSSYQHLLQQLENNEVPNIQYDHIRKVTDTASLDVAYHFENFVHFGSATERLKNFKYKLSLVELYDSQTANINTITGNTSSSAAVMENKTLISAKKTNLIKGFDGYERFLYFESGAYAWPKTNLASPYTLYPITSSQAKDWIGSDIDASSYYGGQLLSASLFDRQNPHTLLNIIPKHIADNPDNSQYFLFSNMVGQHFDQIWSHIHHITKQKDTHHTDGVSKNMVYLALKSLGVETFDQFENANLIEYILGEGSQGNPFYDTPVSQSLVTASNAGSLPKGDITKEVWKRLYHNAPYLLKTKGTERGIHALMNCYGLPSTILNIKEYGGPVTDKSGYKTFSYDKYNYSLTGDSSTTGHFIKTPWLSSNLTSSAKTVEFRIKPYRSIEQYHLFGLSGSNATKDPHLVLTPYTGNDISSSNDSSQYGKIDLYINNTVAASTVDFPIYNGDFWNIHIGTSGTSGSSADIQFGAYQSNFLKNTFKYTATNSQTEADRALTFGDPFSGGGNGGAAQVYLGGVPANPAASYNLIDTLRYSGSLQEVRYHFGDILSDKVLTQHSLEPFMYAGNTLSSSFSNVALRLPLGSNNILHLNSGSYHPNQHITYYTDGSITSNMSSQIWKSNVETHHLVTPDTVGASMSSEKVRLDGGDIDDDILSSIIKSETSTLDRQPQDFEDLGIFFSPQNEINEDIIYTLGGFRLDDYIGSPLKTEQSASSYKDLKTLSDKYFKKYKNNQRYNFWDYTKLIQYIDHTLFKIIEQHVPAKANLKTGLLIEPHYLERNKFPIQTPTTEEFTTMLPDSHQTFYIGYGDLTSISSFMGQVTTSIAISSTGGVILDEPQYGAQAPITPVQTTGIPFAYKPYQSSVLLGNALRGIPSSIYFRSLQLGKETDY
ncbi:MAG: hypothetical protein H8E16_17055 [Flavobacteriales bacterium]|nr:hypothetical protein [Flavobacteriales bacterium]